MAVIIPGTIVTTEDDTGDFPVLVPGNLAQSGIAFQIDCDRLPGIGRGEADAGGGGPEGQDIVIVNYM